MSDVGSATATSAGQELDAIRSAARWLVAASAAVLASLVTGIQVSAIGKTTDPWGWRVLLAIGTVLVAIAAVSLVLYLAARVLVSPGWSLRKLAHLEMTEPDKWRKHPIRADLVSSRTLLSPTEDLDLGRLYRAHRTLFTADVALRETGEVTVATNLLTDPAASPASTTTYRASTEDDLPRLQRRLDMVSDISTRIAQAANLADTQRRYSILVRYLPTLGVLLALCVASFVLATAPPQGASVTTPVKMQIQFTTDPVALEDADLPQACTGRSIDAIAVGGTFDQPIVTSIGTPECGLRQQKIPSGVAAVIPVVPAKP